MATPTVRAAKAIPQDVQAAIVGLALCRGRLREIRNAVRNSERRANAKMPGAARLASNLGLVKELLHLCNERARRNERARARRAKKAVRA